MFNKDNIMQKFLSKSPEDTENIGKALGETINDGCVIAYRGGLGMGKTCFTRGLAKGLGSNDTVTSPTFALRVTQGTVLCVDKVSRKWFINTSN